MRPRREAYYEDGSFCIITPHEVGKNALDRKNPVVAICGDWFTAHGIDENLGHIRDRNHEMLSEKLRSAFAAWYDSGHVNEEDPNTCILRVKLTDGVLMSHGTRYQMDFVNGKLQG